jgi:predicted metal-dependent phosphotriesterase family hydrolase
MGVMRTVLGDIDTTEAGFVDAHEHLVAHATPQLAASDPDLLLDRPDAVREDLAAFTAAGGGTIIEMTTVDYGRDLPAVKELAAATGVHVIAATGFNTGKYCRAFCEDASAEDLAVDQVRDVLQHRCGVVKFATSLDTIEPWEQTALDAAARTHLETGCPILTHTEAGTMAEEQLRRLARHGVAADAVVLGHLDRNADLETHLRVAARGAYLSYDQIPKPKYATEQRSIDHIAELAKRGLHDRVVVGGDLARRSYFNGWGGGPGLAYLIEDFRRRLAADLEARGLPSQRIVEDVFHNNPARALAVRA